MPARQPVVTWAELVWCVVAIGLLLGAGALIGGRLVWAEQYAEQHAGETDPLRGVDP